MSFTGSNELSIREKIAEKIALSGLLFVVPSPLYFKSKADFWSVLAPKLNQKEIEKTPIMFCSISFLRFEDDVSEGCEDEPLLNLFYNLHLFREYDFVRMQESGAPTNFLKRILKSERDFINAQMNLRQEFLGINPLIVPVLPNMEIETNPLVQNDFAEEKNPSAYIEGVDGFNADLELKVSVFIKS
jgi:hypothetical protein